MSNGGLLCSWNKGSCRRSSDASVNRKPHLAPCCCLQFSHTKRLVTKTDSEADFRPTLCRVISWIGLFLRWHALISENSSFQFTSWRMCSLHDVGFCGSILWLSTTLWPLKQQIMQMISNGGLLCSWNKTSCRRRFDAWVSGKPFEISPSLGQEG